MICCHKECTNKVCSCPNLDLPNRSIAPNKHIVGNLVWESVEIEAWIFYYQAKNI